MKNQLKPFLAKYTSQDIHDTYDIPLKPTHHIDSISEIKIGGYSVNPNHLPAKFGESQLTPVFFLSGLWARLPRRS